MTGRARLSRVGKVYRAGWQRVGNLDGPRTAAKPAPGRKGPGRKARKGPPGKEGATH